MAISLLSPSEAPAKNKIVCSQNTLCIEIKRSGNRISFYAINKRDGLPVTGIIELKLENMRITRGRNKPFVLKGGERRFLFRLVQRVRRKAWRYDYRFRWARGDYHARNDDDHLYRLPYATGKAYRVSQSCNDDFSHFDDVKYAIDFKMPVGTPVYAARGGTVVEVKEDSDKGGVDKKFDEEANSVIIQHSDRTLGMYFHFRKDGAIVETGMTVREGDLIGYSGNTGYSSGPHLHFEVSHPNSKLDEDVSVPIRFRTVNGTVECPKKGSFLIAK